MNWFIVPRLRPKPTTGTYPDWKPRIAKNCRHQCVYCTVGEAEYGGIDNFHVEHFKPKSVFAELENDIDNLYVACAICNRFKSDEWPGEPHQHGATATFLDPGAVDYHQHLEFAGSSVFLRGRTQAGSYMVEQLYLNREQLLVSRRYRTAIASIQSVRQQLSDTLDALDPETNGALIKEIAQASLRVNGLLARLADARPYDAGATRRPAGRAGRKAKA